MGESEDGRLKFGPDVGTMTSICLGKANGKA